jgi:hypothetical protein
MKLFKSNHLMYQVCYFDAVNERYVAYTSRFDINDRITHKGENPLVSIAGSRKFIYNTTEQRRENYEYLMCEKGIRPFTYTDQQWQWHLDEMKEYEHIANCEAHDAWMYEF